jgi:peptidoglycan/LPS O-acetylase OafA/YrhL
MVFFSLFFFFFKNFFFAKLKQPYDGQSQITSLIQQAWSGSAPVGHRIFFYSPYQKLIFFAPYEKLKIKG